MFGNYLKVALRNFLRQKGYSIINVAGLALGMACCTLILLWVQDELSFDGFHEHGDDLCIVAKHTLYGNNTMTGVTNPPALVPVLVEEYPEIIRATRFNGIGTVALRHEERAFYEYGHAVDPDFFAMFTFPLLNGDPQTVLSNSHSIVLTEDLAAKYFGAEDPVGRTITMDGRYAYQVSGIMRNIPANSTLQCDFLIPFATLEELWNSPGYPQSWTNSNTRVFVQLQQGASLTDVSDKIADRLTRADENAQATLSLHQYTRLHLYGLGTVGGGIVIVVLFSVIALFILAIACMNFMNLATARSANRAREIGMRKVAGATRQNIIHQFYGESFFMAFISLIGAVALIELLLPAFNNLVGKRLTADFFGNPTLGLGIVGVAVLTGLVAGSYPALFMSLFQPVKILKGGLGRDARSSGFRKTLVVLQFVLSVILIVVSVTIFRQIDFLQTMNLGFEKDHLVYFQIRGEVKNRYLAVKQELLQHPDILQVAATSRTPLGVYDNASGWEWENKDPGINPLVTYFYSDVDFPATFDIKLTRGRYYRPEQQGTTSLSTGEIVINQTLARIVGADNPVGLRMSNYGYDFTVIGVIEDFHFKPLTRAVEPLMVFHNRLDETASPQKYNFLFARIRPDKVTEAIAYMEEVYKKFNPEFPFAPRFFDEAYGQLYTGAQHAGLIIRYAAGIAVFISCLGLFGLAAFITEQRTKEIGIRKVLGASVPQIVGLLSREFLIRVAIANVIGGLLAFLLMTNWLQGFAYRTAVGWQPFGIAVMVTLAVALLSVGYQAIKAAAANPTETLRHE